MEDKKITVETVVNKPIEIVWDAWNNPEHMTKWNFASDDWHSPSAQNDLKIGGRFSARMEAKDGSTGFDFGGIYTNIEEKAVIEYTMDGEDQRKVKVTFETVEGGTKVTETFDAENVNTIEKQKGGWQSILDNFKKYTESL